MPLVQKITPCLWFDTEAEEAAKFYTPIFKNSKIGKISRYPDAGQEVPRQAGRVSACRKFELDGHTFTALRVDQLAMCGTAQTAQDIAPIHQRHASSWHTELQFSASGTAVDLVGFAFCRRRTTRCRSITEFLASSRQCPSFKMAVTLTATSPSGDHIEFPVPSSIGVFRPARQSHFRW